MMEAQDDVAPVEAGEAQKPTLPQSLQRNRAPRTYPKDPLQGLDV